MIFESKQKIDKIMPYLPLRLARAMAYLRDTDFNNLPDGRHEFEGQDIFAMIKSYKTVKKEEGIAEAHFKYIDVQYLLEGEELIYHASLNEGCQNVAEKRVKDDIVIFSEVEKDTEILFKAGHVVVFFPWDVHRTTCKTGARANKNRKVIIKVRAEE